MLASRANPEQYKTQSYVNNSHFPAVFGNSWTFIILHLHILCREQLNSFPEKFTCKCNIDDCVKKQIKVKTPFSSTFAVEGECMKSSKGSDSL